VLREQHQAGRRITDAVAKLAVPAMIEDAAAGEKLAQLLRQFNRMYRPHEAREDTVLFPAIRGLMTPSEYDKLGDLFEDKEHELFGEHGFEDVVEQVARLEKTLGIYDLATFTPVASG
jgi:hemerythrin-like domain-containing protein